MSAASRAESVSADMRSRGEFARHEDCTHAARALPGVGWQSGSWLLMVRINLFGFGKGFSQLSVPDPTTVRSCSGAM